jgi:hypothetical protein
MGMTTQHPHTALTTDIIEQRALRLAMRLSTEEFRALAPDHLGPKLRKRTDRQLRSLERLLPGDAPLSGEYREGTPEEYSLKVLEMQRLCTHNGIHNDPKFVTIPLIFVLSLIGVIVAIGLSIAQVVHPATIPIAMVLCVLIVRAGVQYAESVDPVLSPSASRRVWNVLAAAVVQDAVLAGELKSDADALWNGWEASGLSWGLVAAAR